MADTWKNLASFNPRTYIRYDLSPIANLNFLCLFQSTYLYKVRRANVLPEDINIVFQSTYLYKVRLLLFGIPSMPKCFNPRTYIRYDIFFPVFFSIKVSFNPRTYIRYDFRNEYSKTMAFWFQSTYLYKVRHTVT